jgi:hypothetical protein
MKRLFILSALVLVLPFLIGASCLSTQYSAKLRVMIMGMSEDLWKYDWGMNIDGDTYQTDDVTVDIKWYGHNPYHVTIKAWYSQEMPSKDQHYYYETSIYLYDSDDEFVGLPQSLFTRID